MCGISGILTQDKNLNINSILETMLRCLQHRGPDDSGLHIQTTRSNNVIGLGNNRLAVIDLSTAGHQPMQDPESKNWIVHNGEIYNFLELREYLHMKGHQFRSRTDTEVILKAYTEWGIGCLEHFKGMFAFAIWDDQKQCLWLARDRLGVKPLYYYQNENTFIFSSEIRSLLTSRCIPKTLSPTGIDTYLALGGVREPWTIIDQVYSLPAGYHAILNDDKLTLHPYWSPPELTNREYSFWPRERIVGRLRDLLAESIRMRLLSDVPLGIFLSGGVDSSSIVSLATHNSSSMPTTISIVFNEREYSEAGSIQLVAKHFNTRHSEILLTSEEMVRSLPHALAAMDQPSFDGINTYFVSKSARQAGMTVVLSGIGGDELFGGYPSFQWAPRLEKLKTNTPAWMRKVVHNVIKAGLKNNSRSQKLQQWFGDQNYYNQAYYLVRELFSPDVRQLLIPELKSTSGYHPSVKVCNDQFNQISILELTDYLKNVILRDSDSMSMAHSLEIREPFLDHQIIEFLLSLPGNIKTQGSIRKSLLVEAIDNLPSEITHRKKQVFHLPFRYWLRGPLKNEVQETLCEPNRYLHTIFDTAAASNIWLNFQEDLTSWVRPWSLYVLRKWVHQNL